MLEAIDVCCLATLNGDITAELLKTGGETMAWEFHVALAAIWPSGTIPPDLLKVMVTHSWKGEGNDGTSATSKASRCSAYQAKFMSIFF